MLNELSSISIEELANTCINTIKSNIISLRKLNILILGKSGVGKSTLINSVFREELADTGIGRPVTPKIREIKKEGFPLTIYDTKGLELGKEAQDEVKEEVAELIKKGLYSADVNKCIHCIWYCINTMSNRVEPEEIEWIKSLSNSSDINKVPIIVILTNSVLKSTAEEMKKVIVEENLPIKSVVSVLAQDYIEDEKVFKSNGLDTLINVMAQVLPDELQNTLQNVQKASLKHKRKLADKAVRAAAASAVAAGVTPIPFADSMVLIPIQITMMASITAVYGIGVDSNQDNLYPGIILTSMMKYVDNAVFDVVKSTIDGKFEAKLQVFGIKENGVGTTNFEFTKDKIGEENIKRLEQIKQDIKDGKIQVKSTL